ncbi:hypothetical protein HD806DRAFT_33086 [Xylariaceae sp. AK1471]|nr:hypothetical protein HD806DRAFT_33086 [Xylariaceae sp. AK1471]
MDDPWNWDVERVVQELCTPNQPWYRSSAPLKLPPLDKLEAALREHEVDGELLLTYDQTELCAELGIRVLKHKATFKNAIKDIQLRSNRYRLYRKRQASEFEEEEEVADEVQQPELEVEDASEAGVQLPNTNGSSDAVHPDSTASASTSTPLQDGPSLTSTDEQTLKKRRVVPVLITTEIDPKRNRIIATEADTVRFRPKLATEPAGEPINDITDNLLPGVYLGTKSITRFDVVDFNHLGQLEPLSEEDKKINLVPTSRLIPGRMIQTHRLMKRHLLRHSTHQRTTFAKPDIVPGSNNPDHDEVLPLYGDSDDDMEYDSDTWREIEADRKEMAKNPPRPQGLAIDEIKSTFERVIAQFALDWSNKKLPKYASKANRIWNDARRYGLKDAIDRAQRDLHEFEARITKWKETVPKNDYRNVKELESALAAFEPSVFDREHRSWLIRVLTSPSEPAKISRPRQPRERPSKPQLVLSDDEEILTSDSEDDLRDFIDDDELDAPMMADNGSLAGTGKEGYVEHTGHPEVDMDFGEDGNSMQMVLPEFDTESSGEDRSVLPQPMVTPSRIRSTRGYNENLKTPSRSGYSVIIDLTTPPDRTRRIIQYKGGKLSLRESPCRGKEDIANSPLMMGIADLTSAEQKVAKELMITDQVFIDVIFSITRCYSPEDIWLDLILITLERECPKAPYDTHTKKDGLAAYTFVRLFEIYKDDAFYKLSRYRNLDDKGKQRIRELYTSSVEEWDTFIGFIKRLSDRFEWTETDMRRKKQDDSVASTSEAKRVKGTDKASRADDTDVTTDTDSDAEGPPPSSVKKKKRKRKEIRNREAAMAREMDQAGAAERDRRRKLLRERLETEGSTALGSQQGGIIVNESKGDDQGFVYIHNEIAQQIKEHQVQGVRFMWDQLIVAKKRQGCLLAHTMGLGKTMQIITLLVTIGQASVSDDPTVSSQIPEEMRESKTLILCPATLVNNWLDEMLSWLPEDHGLGVVFKVDSVMPDQHRKQAVQAWASQGGIMVIGYNLFKSFVDDEQTRDIFLQGPNIVVADEAHMMKNRQSQIHLATGNFRTLTRVALTGSPLANNVEEYYSMINWVAPNYLGDIREFRARYANPIKEGLGVDSTDNERRHALRMLRVLKTEVSPKVNRITIAVLKNDIPIKKEFVITVPLTSIQRQAYEMFIQHHHDEESRVPVFAIHDLGLICASPLVFLNKLKDMKNQSNTNQSSSSAQKSETVVLPQQLISDELTLLRGVERDPALDEFSLSWKIPILLQILDLCKKLGDYVLLFSHSKLVLDYLERVLRRRKLSFVRLDGTTPMVDRQNIVKGFNRGNIDIFLISTKAGSLGLNITGANRVIIFDAKFNPQDEQQAVGRAYRIGQKKPVYVYRFVCGGTLEQKLLSQAIWKMQLASRVVDKKHPIPRAQRFSGAWVMPEDPEQEDLDKHLGKDIVLDAILVDEKYRDGIRAVEMMDVFEEEAVEEAELSAEDRAMADQMIAENEARRSGRPLPGHLLTRTLPGHLRQPVAQSSSHMFPPGFAIEDNLLMFKGPSSFTGPPNGSQPAAQSSSAGPAGERHPLPQPSFAGPPEISQPLPQPSPVVSTIWTNGVPASQPNPITTYSHHHTSGPSDYPHDPRPQVPLAPMQLPGAEVHIRPLAESSNGASAVGDTDWNTLAAVEGDLSRAFAVNAGFPDRRTRASVARSVSTAIWDRLQHRASDQRSTMKWAIMHAASSERFIEALCMVLISPHQLAQMTPEGIDQQLKIWKETDVLEWEAKRASWYPLRKQPGDPEHLQTALQRLSTAPPKSGESSRQPDPSKSRRLDDRDALQAVFERRRLKTQQKDDQKVLQAVMERRKATHSPSQPSDSGKEPRLPDWAKELVRQARIPPPSSSAPPPSTPSSPTFSLRPQKPRTPFK